jgi:hypothetical protein
VPGVTDKPPARKKTWITAMSARPRRPGSNPRLSPPRSTANATPTLAVFVRGLAAGKELDDLAALALRRLGQSLPAAGLSTSWEGLGRLVGALTALGCYVETQAHADRCLCRVSCVLKGNAVAKQLASAEGAQMSEAVARAAVLACLEMEPPA